MPSMDSRPGDVSRVLAGETVTYQYPGLLEPGFDFISGFLFRLLSEVDLGYLTELVLVLLKETVFNCSKAIAKRVYFHEKGLDIMDPAQYESGMVSFGNDVLKYWDEYRELHKDVPFWIRVSLGMDADALHIEITNNAQILPFEMKRIKNRISAFEASRDVHSIMDAVRDDTEGAGLGIVLVLVLLQNAGISTKNFQIESGNGQTTTRVAIPLKIGKSEVKVKFKERILAEVSALPSFPANITQILNLCDSSSASLSAIATEIQRDPALTAQILKLVNSAGYMNRFRSPSLTDAVKIIGVKTIRNLLLVSGARNVISSRYRVKDLETIWEASNRVSFFARKLARQPDIADAVSVAGLLFELGKIVLLALDPSTIKLIADVAGATRIRNSSVLEEITLGMSHPEVGALLAEKWRFPAPLVAAIRYQQKPLQSPDVYVDVIHSIYMAVRLHEAGLKTHGFYTVEPSILTEFGITTEEGFKTKAELFEKDYSSQAPAA
ncbi:MAG: HDOD domain-containing protein [Spirochaetia bacterium]|nr:HDOD domain-containing protein [Spirochaetia bacterium]